MRTRILIARFAGAAVFGSAFTFTFTFTFTFAFAAALDLGSDNLAAGDQVVSSCDADGVTATCDVSDTAGTGYTVSSVEVAQIDAACAAGWTLADAPSGATVAAVSVSGPWATLELTEGTGAAATDVGAFTVALAATEGGVRDDVVEARRQRPASGQGPRSSSRASSTSRRLTADCRRRVRASHSSIVGRAASRATSRRKSSGTVTPASAARRDNAA